MSLPLAIMLRESRLLSGDRLLYLLGCLPLLAIAAIGAILALGSYRAVWRYIGSGEIVRLAQFALVAIILFWLGQFVVDRLVHLPPSGPAIQFLVAMFLLIGSRIAYSNYCRWQEGPASPHRRPLLLIGGGDGTALFIQMLTLHRAADYEVVGILCDNISRHRHIAGVPVLGKLADIDKVLANLRVQGMAPARLIVTRPHHELGRAAVQYVMRRAYAARIPVEQLPDIISFKNEAGVYPGSSSVTHGIPQESLYPRLKRLFDIAVSATLIVLLAPLMAVAAIAVGLGIQRPILFVQIRQGLHHRRFKLLKFRTMKDPLDDTGRPLDDAERTPRVGRFLRRTRLDELPQFWNVLKGDMAIIGPRPLITADLLAMPDGGYARARTRPGITGWAQVNGGHQLAPDEKLSLDLWYADNASLALDARIVWRTIIMMLVGEAKNDDAIATARAALTPEPAE